MADDDERPYEFPAGFKVHAFGIRIPIAEEHAPSWQRTIAIMRESEDLYSKLFWWQQRVSQHEWHDRYMPADEEPWSPAHPKCDLCTWPWRIWFLWHEVHEYADAVAKAEAEAARPKCQAWAEGDVEVIRHAEECTCHEACDGGGDGEW